MRVVLSLQISLILLGLYFLVPIKAPNPPACGPNQTFIYCGGPCDTRCDTLGKPCNIQNIKCPDMCYCNDGYARDAYENCIPKKQCPPTPYGTY